MSKKNRHFIGAASQKSVKIIPLGGLEQIGMNITAFEYEGSIIVVDCGLAFPDDDMLGVDLVVPDVSYLKNNIEHVRAFFITHGHEDHIGALSYVLKEVNVPIYATNLTMAIIEDKLEENGMLESVKRHVVEYGQTISTGGFSVEFIRSNHSIADAAALAIFTGAGTIIHTGDFKVDYTPVHGDHIDLQRLGELGRKGVLALLSDSTNAIRPGFTPSERNVSDTFSTVFSEYSNKRILVATFASNVDRVQQIIDAAVKFGRKVAIDGRSMVKIVEIAKNLGYLQIPENVLIDIESLNSIPDEKIAIIMTGSQGEAMAALARVASGRHARISVSQKDVVVFSSTPIPGNEKAVAKVMNALSERGARIINTATHVSGHACREDLKLIYALTKPKYAIPVHGEYRYREANADIAQEMQVQKENIFLLNSGQVLTLNAEEGAVTGTVPHGGIMIDGNGVGDVGSIVLKDRQNLSQDGIIVVCLTIDSASGTVVAGPEIVSRGFIYMRENADIMEEARNAAADAAERVLSNGICDWGRIRNEIRDELSSYFWQLLKRNPVILPVIMEI